MRRLLLALLLAACTQAPATPDAAATDAPIVDAPVDAGVVDVVDAGAPVDAAPPTDMASSDIAPPDVGVEATVPADVAAVDAPFVDAPVEAAVDAGPPAPTVAATMWRTRVEPLLVTRCGSCHLGTRFNLATLLRATDVFTEAESARNRETFVDHISLDVPSRSRILDKILPATDPDAMPHGADVRVADRSDPLVTTLTAWIEAERAERCPDCGPRSATSWIAYVDQPTIFSMIERSPIRTDRGERRGAKIYLRAVDPVTLLPRGEPVDFLGSFCPAGDDCDWGRLAVSNDGAQLAFECRMPLAGEPWIQRAWNLCIADIGPDGRARNARFLLPPGQRKTGATHARVDPFGVRPDSGVPSPWDVHFELRNRNDYDPTFSPDGSRVYFTSEAPDPRSGADMVQTYHGTFHLGHLVSARTDGSDLRTIYRNEGGSADSPTFLRSGDVVFHTWNLERMDRHMYIRATPDGMMEVPVFLGRVQGPDMWGRAVQLADGTLLGMTGRRRATTSLYSPFLAEHSAGISNVTNYTDGAWHGFKFMFPALESELDEYGFCTATTPEAAATAPRCSLSQRIDDPSWAPNGGVLVTSNPERTYIPEGEGFFLTFGRGAGVADRQASVAPYLPQHQGIAALDRDGTIRRLLDPPAGRMLRWPVWVGRRWAPRVRPQVTDETRHDAELHLADARVWMSFEENTNGFGSKIQNYTRLTEMTSVRVLRKMSAPNACILDTPYLRQSMGQADGFHPSALGMIDATGYEQLVLPASAGGTASGDVPLQADGSVAMRVPAGDLLLFQGIDANGRMVGQHRRVFTMPPGWHVDTSVRRAQYQSQCARCHGAIAATESFAASQDLPHLPAVMDFDTLAARAPLADFTAPSVTSRELTFRAVLRPLLDARCVRCHSGESPPGGLSLQTDASPDGNVPPADWLADGAANPAYLTFLQSRVGSAGLRSSPNATVTWSWLFQADDPSYRARYATDIAADHTLGALAPWDAGYRALFRRNANGWVYLNTTDTMVSYGRVTGQRGNASRSFLLEVLGVGDLDPHRNYTGSFDHRGLLTDAELRAVSAVMDVGLPYMARCGDRTVSVGPNASGPWGEASATPTR